MRSALADKLAAADLSWAPSADAVAEHAAEAAEPAGRLHKLADNETVRRDATYILVVAGLVALVGGYAGPWKWTGFEANGQVWDWLNLLLLPVVLGTIPLWIQDREYIGRGRRIIYGAFMVAFTIFVIAGYLVPISWTGFNSQKLWNWIELLVLPAALASTAALTSRGIRYQGRLLRPYERGMVIALMAGWIITIIGGYALRWTWTGYSGNTLWDWLQMLLVPLVFPRSCFRSCSNGSRATRPSGPPWPTKRRWSRRPRRRAGQHKEPTRVGTSRPRSGPHMENSRPILHVTDRAL